MHRSAQNQELDARTAVGAPPAELSRASRWLKRGFDLGVGTLALLLFSPLMLSIAIWIRFDSAGPVLFRQSRIGRGGQPFDIVKFRSMIVGAEGLKQGLLDLNQAGEGLFKIPGDPRITRAGRHIRSTHLDELPQLFSVLRGEMSLVGPRPLVAEEDALVRGREHRPADLAPGMTGPWQIQGPMTTALVEMAILDFDYASNWSLWGDIVILSQTIVRMLSRGGH